jgi:major membrane immunogen (membrane-anchored lipoprotein)
MKKSILFLLILPLLLTGCMKSDVEPIIEPEPIEAGAFMTIEEAKVIANDYIFGMKEYSEKSGYHIEEIDSYQADCPGCYVCKYEYRIRPEGVDGPMGVADVTITVEDGKVADVLYWDDMEDTERSLPVQDSPMIGGQRDEHGCLGPAGYQWCEVTQECQRLWEESCIEDPEFNADIVERAFLKKYPDWAKYDMEIRISKQVGDYASGGAVPRDTEIGGGYWFAAKTDNGWVIAADGNGNIFCSEIEPYDFPSDMIPECWDDVNMVPVER